MDTRLLLEVIAIIVLILANGFFALSEFSIIASRKSKLLQKAREGKMGAATALKLHDDPEGFLATVQIGITLVGALVGVVSGATVVEKLEIVLRQSSIEFVANAASAFAVGIVVVSITILSALVGELVPKYIAISFPERYARLLAGPVHLFYKVSYVFARTLRLVATGICRLMGIRMDRVQRVISEEEINHIIVDGREKGLFEIGEEQFIKSVFEFTDSTVRRAMKPRTDVVGIDLHASVEANRKLIVDSGYSRFPVYEGDLDTIVGVLYTKDLITQQSDPGEFILKKLVREPFFVPDSMPLPRLLKEFQRGKNHLAIVLDEFGGTAGIVTLEDILEELVGEIRDEYDAEADPIVRLSPTVVHADGSVRPGEINDLLGSALSEDEEKTLAGLFIDEVGRVPNRYESVQLADVKMTVLAKDKNRIVRVRVEKSARNEAPEGT